MPIGGFVINIDTDLKEQILEKFSTYSAVEVHGVDEDGNVVAVLDTETSDEMNILASELQTIEGVLSVGVTYFDAEDEMEKIEKGLLTPTFSFGRKGEKPKGNS